MIDMYELRNKHVTRLGYPTDKGGALYYVLDQEGLCQMAVDIEVFRYLYNRTPITPQVRSQILSGVRCEQSIYNSLITDHGVPDKILSLLNITKKDETTKYCKNMTISEFELFLFIQNCNLIGFSHESKFPDFVPEHLLITNSDKEKLVKGDPKPVSKKLTPLLNERRHIHVHMFHRGSEWHCFYFSYDDIEKKESNHWKYGGSHLHYLNYLWSSYTMENVWDAFDTRKTKLSDLHIKFEPYDYPEPGDSQNHIGNTPGVFAFDPTTVSDYRSDFTPPIQVTTRGCYIASVALNKFKNYFTE